jgi:MoxR-like ATPase
MIQRPLETLQLHIEKVFVGKTEVVQNALVTLLAGGHFLVEDVPGVGKTTLALALARSIGCTFQRIQFTSDMMPADILGVSILNRHSQEFEFRAGGIFHQVILADELNRATPRTQSALLEAMNERQVSLDGHTHILPDPFFVMATQNPHEHHGTFPLPESQLDRFTMRLSIGYPDPQHEKKILILGTKGDAARDLEACVTAEQMSAWISAVRGLHVAGPVDDYLLAIIDATRRAEGIAVGASPRGAIALRRAAQARAFMHGRDHVTPDDVKALAIPVLAHRLLLDHGALGDTRAAAEQKVAQLLHEVAVPL